MNKYLVVVEQANGGFSAYSPDLPGCVATGKTRAQVEQNMAGAIRLHIEGLQEDGEPVPKPHTYSTYCDVGA